MKKFILKLLLFSIPIYLVIGSFFVFDPFKILYSYNNLNQSAIDGVPLNNDFLGTEVYINQVKQYQYDSFVFGNSRSMGFRSKDWQKYLKSTASIYYFVASSENLFGISKKINFINNTNGVIKNALVLLDYNTLYQTKESNKFHNKKHPAITKKWLPFYFSALDDYLGRFTIEYIDFKLFNTYRPYMKNIDNKTDVSFDPQTNEWTPSGFNKQIESEGQLYYKNRSNIFYERNNLQSFHPPVIEQKQLLLLKEIKAIFNSQKTNYKIIIMPLYDQIKLNDKDIKKLNNIFGESNIYDFSGINEYTKDMTNYYEDSHFKNNVGHNILNTIYNNQI